MNSEKFLEQLDGKTRIAHDAAHSNGIYGVVTRNRENANPVRHDDMLALTQDTKAGFLQGSNRILMIDAGYLWHS